MIFGNIKDLDLYSKMGKEIEKCLKYINENDISNFSKGVHEIEGDDFFVNIVEYDLCNDDERFWEAHKSYLDVHFMIHGSERIKLNFLDNLCIKGYDEKIDFVNLEDSTEMISYVDLRDGYFLICYPTDAHKTALKIDGDEHVKKAIFKIKLK